MDAVYRPESGNASLKRTGGPLERPDTSYTPTGQSFGKTIFDVLSHPVEDVRSSIKDITANAKETLLRSPVYVLVTGAINSPFTSEIAAKLLKEWRDGGDGLHHFFGHDSVETKDLFFGNSGEYYRNITVLGISQLASAHHGTIPDGKRIKIEDIPDFSGSDGAFGMRDGINVGDVIGTFSYGVRVEASDGYLYFTGENSMSLESFAAQNKLEHDRVTSPKRGPFSTTYQTFEWRVPIPPNMVPK